MRFAFAVLGLAWILFFGVLGAWGWIPALAATEWTASFFLRRRYGEGGAASPFRMEPHTFAHFVPSRRHPDISAAGFRVTRPPRDPQRAPAGREERPPLLYLAGDCTLFEDHLPVEETFAWQLNALLPEHTLLNAGAPHYTALHSYNRFVVDLVRGHRPDAVLLFSNANDMLTFIHHKEGFVSADHAHLCRPWGSDGAIYRRLRSMPTATLRLILLYLLCGGRRLGWEEMAEDPSAVFREPKSVRRARELFHPGPFVTCLELFRGTCEAVGAQLILTTYPYQKQEMREEPRRTYAWGMDLLNEEIRRFAQRHSLGIIDLAAEMAVEPADIRNKWHYTAPGNTKRARIVAGHLRDSLSTRPVPSDAALRS